MNSSQRKLLEKLRENNLNPSILFFSRDLMRSHDLNKTGFAIRCALKGFPEIVVRKVWELAIRSHLIPEYVSLYNPPECVWARYDTGIPLRMITRGNQNVTSFHDDERKLMLFLPDFHLPVQTSLIFDHVESALIELQNDRRSSLTEIGVSEELGSLMNFSF